MWKSASAIRMVYFTEYERVYPLGGLMFRKRQVPRVKLNVPAWIEVGNSALLERCTLIDLSEKGARLVIGDISHLTDHFCLYLTRVGHVPQRCRILWRRDHQVGVEFDGHEASAHKHIATETVI